MAWRGNLPREQTTEHLFMAPVTTDTNGRVRKSLAEQIDRLDGILDGLADGLNEAVVTAVKEAVGAAVQEAVRAVLGELLGNPDLLRMIRESLAPLVGADARPAPPGGAAPPGAPFSSLHDKCRTWLRARLLCGKVCLSAWLGRFRTGLRAARTGVCAGGRFVGRLWRPLVIAVGIGGVVGVGAYLLGPWLSTVAGGLAGFTTSLAVQARLALRQALGCANLARG
jgi:hypothetical protein